MKGPDAWNARQQQLRLAGNCAICGKSNKGDHTACSLEAERRRNEHAPGELSQAQKEQRFYKTSKRKYLTGRKLPPFMFS